MLAISEMTNFIRIDLPVAHRMQLMDVLALENLDYLM